MLLVLEFQVEILTQALDAPEAARDWGRFCGSNAATSALPQYQ